jgi:hypothetical protein
MAIVCNLWKTAVWAILTDDAGKQGFFHKWFSAWRMLNITIG